MGTNGHPTWSDSEAGQQLEQRLATEKTLKALDHILARIETIEKAVDGLSTVMSQGPGMVSMAADMVDEGYKNATARGVDIDAQLKAALAMAEKLTSPAMVEKLDGLIEFANQAPGLMSMTADMVDEGYKNATARGIDIDNRLQNALAMAEKLTAPAMVEKLDNLLSLADQAPGLMSMAIDTVDETFKDARNNGVDINERIKLSLALAEKFTAPKTVAKVDDMLTLVDQLPGLIAMAMDTFDGVIKENTKLGLDMDAIKRIMLGAATAISRANEMPPAKVGGPIGLMRAMKDKDRQRALSFLMDFAKAFGQGMK